jgi:hypothetical protein
MGISLAITFLDIQRTPDSNISGFDLEFLKFSVVLSKPAIMFLGRQTYVWGFSVFLLV